MRQGVSILLFNEEGKILLSQRLNTSHSGFWQGAGGKVEDGELPELAMIREVKEEAGITLEVSQLHKLVETEQWSLSNYVYMLHGYMATARQDQQPQRMEPDKHSEWKWVDLDKALDEYNLLKGVRTLIEEYKKVKGYECRAV